MNRQLLGLTGALVASVSLAVPSSTADTNANATFKKAALMGKAPTASARQEQVVSRLIVKLRNSSAGLASPMSASKVQALSRTARAGMKSIRSMAGDASLLELDAPMALSEAKAVAARLEKDPAVEYAVPDIMLKKLLTPNEPNFIGRQWNLFAPTATFTGAILPAGGSKSAPATGGANLELAWDVTQGSNSVVVAIVDTGIVNHPDLNGQPAGDIYVPNGRFLPGYDFISGNVGAGSGLPTNFVANDGDGRDADASDPGDWVTTQEETMYAAQCDDGATGPQNSSWHGSHMAGVAGAMTNNSIGHAGIGWNIRILPVRALGKCGGSLSDIGEAILWAAGVVVPGAPINATPAQVINLSLGSDPGTACDAFMQGVVNQAIAAGAVVVAATGNDGTVGISSPAKCTGVIAVTSNTINGDNSDFANIGAASGAGPQATLSASGGGSPTSLGVNGATDDPAWTGFYIWSSVLFGNTSPTSADGMMRTGPAYAGFTGTSPATPQVAGVAALIKSIPAAAAASPAFVRSWISAGGNVRAHPANGACAVFLINCGKGLLDANLAINAAVNLQPAVTTGPNLVVLPGTNVSFNATALAYAPKTLASTVWSQVGTPTVVLNGATTTNVSFTAPASPATVVLRFRATDSAVKVADDLVTVRVNRPPVLGAVPPAQTVTVGQTVNFTVTATEPDGEPVFFAANAIPQGATFSSAGVFNWDTTGVTPTTTTFTYVATDTISASSQGSVTITVNAAAVTPPPAGAPPPTGGGGGGGSLPFWQLVLLGALSLAARVRAGSRSQ